MKKLILLAALCLLAAGCADGAVKRLEKAGYDFDFKWENNTGSSAVNVYNWGEYLDEDLNKAFEQVTGIKVHYDTYQTNEALYAKLRTGGSSYDVIVPSDYMIGLLIEEDMLEEPDFGNIPNYAGIEARWKGLGHDPEERYSVPYMWGAVGIIYDKTRVSSQIDSWGALFDEQYRGQILMFENSRDAFAIALKILGYSLNTAEEGELREAYTLLAAQKPLVQAYVMDQIFDKMEGGEAILAPYYAGDALTMMESNDKLAFVVPKEGSNYFIDAFCIPKGAPNKAAAEMYINFMCLWQAGDANAETTRYSSPLSSVAKDRANPLFDPDDLSPFEMFQNLPRDARGLYNRLWTDLFA